MGKKLTNTEFIEKANITHNNKYDYSATNYICSAKKVKILCVDHGEFLQCATAHIRGQGCPKCSLLRVANYNIMGTEKFIENANRIHGDKYDYSLVKYKKSNIKVKIICKEHGIFEQFPSYHLGGSGCPKCSGKNKNTKDIIKEFKKIHGDKYDYSLVDFQHCDIKLKIICREHGVFEQLMKPHKFGQGCPKCIGRNKSNEEIIKEFKKIHGDKYDYSLVDFQHCDIKLKIICREHGVFYQKPYAHIRGQGCKKCNSSHGERIIRTYLIEKCINFEEQKKFKDCYYKSYLRFDFYIPEYNLCIEYDGEQHFMPYSFSSDKSFETKFKNLEKTQHRDTIKTKYCVDNNIKLLRISYLEKNNIEKILNNFLSEFTFKK